MFEGIKQVNSKEDVFEMEMEALDNAVEAYLLGAKEPIPVVRFMKMDCSRRMHGVIVDREE